MSTNFYELNPNLVLHAVEKEGYQPTGYLTQLNSYENRVMSIQFEVGSSVIAKFYRPVRWSRKALLDEHSFLVELQKKGIPRPPTGGIKFCDDRGPIFNLDAHHPILIRIELSQVPRRL